MTDIVDQTEDRLDLERAAIAARAARRVAFSGVMHCEDCSDPIPEERRVAAPFATRCIDCQQKFEKEA